MRKEDEDKTAFYTDHGTFCYQKMPFGLKNARATYQRLVDKVFKDQIGRNVEVYVDDMVIKSRTEQSLLQDIGLNGQITALGRFVAKSAEKALPLFNTLKGCVDKHNCKWTEEAETALAHLKEAMKELPTLACPVPGERLYIFLAASPEAISAVLTVERERQQRPVYFVSRALQGSELCYPKLEKLFLALIYAARRLRRYFQAHHVEVLTSQPIRQILLKPEKSGRLAKWAIELGEHDIEYKPRTSIKGQALADFLAEIPKEDEEARSKSITPDQKTHPETWTLYTEGPTSKEGSGAGLVLTSPEGEEITYSLRFNFQTSNNEAEYGELLAGMRLARENGEQHLLAHSDSLLVTNQINETYEMKDQRIKKYTEEVKRLATTMESFVVKQVPRSANRKADALSKLAFAAFDHLSKEVLVEVLKERSIDGQEIAPISMTATTWMTPLIDYLTQGLLPTDDTEARKIKVKAPQYAIRNDTLYRRGHLEPWLKCITGEEGKILPEEIHAGKAGAHEGARALTGKTLRAGVYWPQIHTDAKEVTKKCAACQTFSPLHHSSAAPLTSISSPWPFYQWGIDIVGPFLEAPGRVGI
ncbi:hypothetical protein L2E82_30317 [Cichorium intybus]|uniref:Uncharacterized protein n=1 Tax=Cichorium intybus TaxID=13427 RepID=A0ACB9D029_CICIN|nr:hypothetical protein L2E82_30317 [Cichorium intybus]